MTFLMVTLLTSFNLGLLAINKLQTKFEDPAEEPQNSIKEYHKFGTKIPLRIYM